MFKGSTIAWQLTSTSALAALLAIVGCALPVPFGSSQHTDNLLQSLTQREPEQAAQPKLTAPPELVREGSPYPTAVSTAKVPAPPPLLDQRAPPAIALDRKRDVGRIPDKMAFHGTLPGAPSQQSPAPSAAAAEQVAPVLGPPPELVVDEYPQLPPRTGPQPIKLEVAPANELASYPPNTSVSDILTYAEKSWPTTASHTNIRPTVAEPVNVKPQAPPQFSPPTAAPALSPANEPAPQPPTTPKTEPTESADVLLPKMIAALQRDIRERKDRKEDVATIEQKLRLLQLVADDTDDAVDQIEQLPPAEREAFKQMMFALTTWLSPDDAKRSSLRNAKILRALEEVNERLSAVSKLDLKNLMFCEKVESFGWYTEFPRAEFAPKQQVILYVEVQNFNAEEKTTNAFETELQGSYQIFDGSGNIVDERQLPLDREVCRNFRRDYFLAYRIYLPADMTAGRYRLELTIEDLKSKKDFKGRKQGEAMIEFGIK